MRTRRLVTVLVLPLFLIALASAETAAQDKIMIFGGRGHDTYLGCLSCSEFSSESVFNQLSRYGSSLSTTSIHNNLSRYGSSLSRYSACSSMASDPPVIVNQDGDYYGRLTINDLNPEQIQSSEILGWLRRVCAE